ncbi:hypothetical protein LBMAG42_55050 [Deltaproteobacteria bacterium]|nr:hypothetical protein LBMAG42_55050 [Deltaproteobacteria bacterium]
MVYTVVRPVARAKNLSRALGAARRFICDALVHAERTRGVFTRCGAESRAWESVVNQAIWEFCGGANLAPSPDPTVKYPFFKREHSITLPCTDGTAVRRRVDYMLRLPGAGGEAVAVEIKALRRKQSPRAAALAVRDDVAKMQFLLSRGLVSSALVAVFGLGLTQEKFEDRVTCGAGTLNVKFPRIHPAIRVAFIEVDTTRQV